MPDDEQPAIHDGSHREADRDIASSQLKIARHLNWITLFGAIVSALAFVAVAVSVVVAERVAEDGRRALVAANRAWLGTLVASLDQAPKNPEDHLHVHINVQNFGKEPATEVTVTSDVRDISTDFKHKEEIEHDMSRECLSISDETAKNISGSNKLSHIIFPVNDTNQGVYSINEEISGDTVNWDFIYGLTYLNIQGCILYKSYSIVRHTSFCYLFRAGSDHEWPLLPLRLCSEGNDAN